MTTLKQKFRTEVAAAKAGAAHVTSLDVDVDAAEEKSRPETVSHEIVKLLTLCKVSIKYRSVRVAGAR